MDFDSVGEWAGGAVLVAITAIQTIRAGVAKKKADEATVKASEAHLRAESASAVSITDLAKSNADLAAAYKTQGEEWKALAEKTYKEQQEYRTWVHNKAEEDNALMLMLTAENADLKARTDLTPLMDYMKRYDANQQIVATSLAGLTETIRLLIKHVAPDIDISKI